MSMQSSISRTLLAALVVLGSTGYAFTQTERTMVLHGDGAQSMGAIRLEIGGFDDRDNAKGIPLTADVVTTHVQYLSDGNKITNDETSHFYRDSEGRTRRENKLMLPGHSTDTPTMIMINDPVAHTRFVLNTVHKSADQVIVEDGPADANVMYMKKRQDEQVVINKAPSNEQPENKEDLGTQSIEGVTARGTRTSHVIPAGKIGNEKPITVTTESWFSDEVGMEVLRVHKDPWSGEVTTKVTNIRRGEPDASLFTAPADYKVEKMEGGKHIMRIEKDTTTVEPPKD
jgi:hypothetical protein